MIAAERLVTAGSDAVDIYVDSVVEACRAKTLQTLDERAACVKPAEDLLAVTDPAINAFVAALRGYWAAKASKNQEAIAKALTGLQAAVDTLPPEYFAGVKALLQ